MRMKALCPEPNNYSEAGLAAIRAFADLEAETLNRDELSARIDACDLLFVRLKTFVDDDLLRRASRLKAIVTPTTGLNHIDVDFAESRGVKVFHLKGEVEFLRTVTSTAEHTWALLLALVRHIPSATADVADGTWQQDVHRGRELHGKTLGILGFGRLGEIVARYGQAFGMRIRTYDIRTIDVPNYVDVCASLGELLRMSDVLTLHVPLNADTEGLIGRKELSELPDGAFLVNTSRGEIIDEQALVEALEMGRLQGVASDVVANEERHKDNILIQFARTHPNVLITPHIGGATFEAVEKTDLFVIRRLTRWLDETP